MMAEYERFMNQAGSVEEPLSRSPQWGVSIVGTQHRLDFAVKHWLIINSGHSEYSKVMLNSWRGVHALGNGTYENLDI